MTGPTNRELADRFNRAAGPGARLPEPLISSPAMDGPRRSKFTVILDARDAEEFDALVLTARRTLGRRVDKSELVRAVIALLGRDSALRREIYQVIYELELQHDQEARGISARDGVVPGHR